LDISHKIKFVGEIKPDDVTLWMNACDVLVLPSLNEGRPNVLSEALACAKPVIATNVAGNPEIVNKDVGYLVALKDSDDLAEKIDMTLQKKWDKKKLITRAQKFSVTNSVNMIIKIYTKLLKN